MRNIAKLSLLTFMCIGLSCSKELPPKPSDYDEMYTTNYSLVAPQPLPCAESLASNQAIYNNMEYNYLNVYDYSRQRNEFTVTAINYLTFKITVPTVFYSYRGVLRYTANKDLSGYAGKAYITLTETYLFYNSTKWKIVDGISDGSNSVQVEYLQNEIIITLCGMTFVNEEDDSKLKKLSAKISYTY